MTPDLTPASRRAIDHYRRMADTDPAEAARWTALADELEALGADEPDVHDGQGALL